MDAKPVVSSGWHSQDEAFFNVTEGIRTVVVKVMSSPTPSSQTFPNEPSKPEPKETPATVLKQKTTKPEPLAMPEDFSWLCIRTLTGHKDSIWSVAISPDGQTLASGSADNTIKLWNLKTGDLLRTLTEHKSYVWSVAISPDGQTFASGSEDNTIKLWNLKTGDLLRTLTGNIFTRHKYHFWSVAMSADGQTLASGSGDLSYSRKSKPDNTIKLWNLKTGDLLRTLTEHEGSVWSVAISPDGQTLASGSADNTIKLWNLKTGDLLRTLTGHEGSVWSIAISADGQTLASGSADKTIKLWNLKTRDLLRTLTGHKKAIYCVAISPDGQTLASGSADNTIKLWKKQ